MKYWLALNSVTGIGAKKAWVLAKRFGSCRNVFFADIVDIAGILGGDFHMAKQVLKAGEDLDKFQKFTEALQKNGIQTLCPEDLEYPDLLASIDNPPPVLYRRGKPLDNKGIYAAIVGTRSPTRDGLKTAEYLAMQLAKKGVTIVSGLAKGIDTAAHRGTLKAGGRTIAVLGSGLKEIYPKENRELAERICRDGTVVSECHPNEGVSSKGLIQRNRITSGLSHGVIAIEPGRGTMNTVQTACKQNRHIFLYKSQKPVNHFNSFIYKPIDFEIDQIDLIYKTLQNPRNVNEQLEIF
jgi:DNA processing protein